MPFFQAPPATTGRGVLGDKNRMAAIRGLLAVVDRLGWGQAFGYEVVSMAQDGFDALGLQILKILGVQSKLAAKSGFGQAGEQFVQIPHGLV